MGGRVKSIAISAAVFIGVLLVMCLTAKIMINNDNPEGDKKYEQALDKLSGQDVKQSDENSKTDIDTDQSAEQGIEQSQSVVPAGAADEDDSETADKDDPAAAYDDSSEAADGDVEDETEPDRNKKHVIVIDAAHQQKADTEKEPLGPGSSETKYKVTSGAAGVSTGTPEFKLNLAIALLLEEELKSRGYEVYMIRSTNDVTISDAERARLANINGEAVIHIHANADESEGICGTMAFTPSSANSFVAKEVIEECEAFSKALITGLNNETGAKTWGVIANDNLTALNWTNIPASHVEVGYLSNGEEDRLLQTEEYRKKIATGLADGCDLFFERGSND